MFIRNSFVFRGYFIDFYEEEEEEEENEEISDEKSPQKRREGLQGQKEFAGSLRLS